MNPSAHPLAPLHSVVLEGWKEAVRLARQLPSTERAAFCRQVSARAEGLASLEATLPGDNTLARETQSFVQGIAQDKETVWPKVIGAISFLVGLLGLKFIDVAFLAGEASGAALLGFVAAGGGAALYGLVRVSQGAGQGAVQMLDERQRRGEPVQSALGRIAASERELFAAFARPVPEPPLTLTSLKNWALGGAVLGAFAFGVLQAFSG